MVLVEIIAIIAGAVLLALAIEGGIDLLVKRFSCRHFLVWYETENIKSTLEVETDRGEYVELQLMKDWIKEDSGDKQVFVTQIMEISKSDLKDWDRNIRDEDDEPLEKPSKESK